MSTTAAVISGGIMVAQAVANAMGNYGEAKRQEKLNKYNAAVTEEKIKALNYEEAMNKTLRRLNAYEEIGAGKNYMGSRGNIGSSADSAVLNAYMNLSGDLSAMTFNYENKRVDLRTEKKNYLYQQKLAEAQKYSAITAGVLSTGGAALNAYSMYGKAGGEWGPDSDYWKVAEVYNPSTGQWKKTWHGGIFSNTFGKSKAEQSSWYKAVNQVDGWKAKDANGNIIKGRK